MSSNDKLGGTIIGIAMIIVILMIYKTGFWGSFGDDGGNDSYISIPDNKIMQSDSEPQVVMPVVSKNGQSIIIHDSGGSFEMAPSDATQPEFVSEKEVRQRQENEKQKQLKQRGGNK